MADKNIGALPAAAALDDDSLLVAEQQGKAVHFRGKLLKDYARQGVDALVTAAQEAATKAAQAAKEAQEAADAVADVSADTEAAKAAAVAAENARAAAVQAAQYAENVAALAAQQAAADVANRLGGYVTDAENARAGAAAAQRAAEEAAGNTAANVAEELKGYVSDAQAAQNAAEQAAETAAAEAVQQAESQLQEYVDDAEQAKEDAQSAAGTAAQNAVSQANTQLAGYVSAAQAAQRAAEQARDEAQGIAGGDFASTAYVDDKAATAESNAKTYADQKIAAIPTPDVSGQINTHNTNADAHNDIRLLITELTNRLNALANSEDVDLDQMDELVAYIKANRDLIDQITTGKVSVSDIVNNLTTNVANKPLSAAQGVALKALADAVAGAASTAQSRADAAYSLAESKQNKITGTAGQVVGFDASGNPVAQEAPSGGGTTVIMAETEPSGLSQGDDWDMVMTNLEAPEDMFLPVPAVVTITGTGNQTYCYATINGQKHYGAASNIEVMPGDVITFGVYGRSTTYPGWVKVNGTTALNVTNQSTQTYNWTVPDKTKTVTIAMSYTSSNTQRRGQITVTTT